MKPPYEITGNILKLITSISEKLGEVKTYYLDKTQPELRKQNKIKTIHSSLKIEGNTLSEEQITALINNKRVIGPKNDILEVLNAIEVYEKINSFSAYSVASFKKAHKLLMSGLVDSSGEFRKESVGIVHGEDIAHVAPPYQNVPYLMNDLFQYIKNNEDPILIKSCVFHYEIEFIHPFTDGNGRMGRLWQTVILMDKYPIFEFLPFESLMSKTQKKYYQSLAHSDKKANSTPFIEYLLNVIDNTLTDLLKFSGRKLTTMERLEYLISIGINEFSRKDYMEIFKNISTSTASRDLKKGVEFEILKSTGTKNKTKYTLCNKKYSKFGR
ncbi:MAG: Fic family protein [Bacteroidales bacterium]|nr:Fic family protein [Bacteroidales bacterium]